jgi:hypothetical protein
MYMNIFTFSSGGYVRRSQDACHKAEGVPTSEGKSFFHKEPTEALHMAADVHI